MEHLHPIHLGVHNFTCEKICYPTRKVARRAARTYHGKHKSPYECGDHWHVGDLRPEVVAGKLTRSQAYRNRKHR